MVIMASSPFVRLVEGKDADDHRNRYVGHTASQDVVTVRLVDDSSDGSIKSSGGIEKEIEGCARHIL